MESSSSSTTNHPWLNSYPQGMPQHLNYPAVPLFQFLDDSAQEFPDRTALIFYGQEISYRNLKSLTDKFAKVLQDLGVKRGDRVALLLPNSPAFVIAYFATLKVGGVAIPLNPLYGTVTYVAEPTTMTMIRNMSVAYTTETLNRTDYWVEAPRPITLTFATRTRTTITTPVTIRARTLDYWDENAECFIWFRVLNATSGSRLAEAGLRVEAAP